MVAQLLYEDRNVDGRIKTRRRVKRFLEQYINVPGLAIKGVRTGLGRRHLAVVARQVIQQFTHLAQGGDLVLYDKVSDSTLAVDARPA